MKKTIKLAKKIANFWIFISISIFPFLILVNTMQIKMELNKPTIHYQTDSVGGVGYISSIKDNTITVPGYGQFIVTDAEAEILKVGEKAPEYILQRGQ